MRADGEAKQTCVETAGHWTAARRAKHEGAASSVFFCGRDCSDRATAADSLALQLVGALVQVAIESSGVPLAPIRSLVGWARHYDCFCAVYIIYPVHVYASAQGYL